MVEAGRVSEGVFASLQQELPEAWSEQNGTFLVHPNTRPGVVTNSQVTVNVNDGFSVHAVTNGPKDLPAFRAALTNAWDRNGTFTATLRREEAGKSSLFSRTRGEWEHRAATDAHLMWVSEDLTDVIDGLRPTLPGDTVLSQEDVPWPAGIAVFARPLVGVASVGEHAGESLSVRAVMWAPIRLRPLPGQTEWKQGIGISSYQLCDFDEGLSELGLIAAQDVIVNLLRFTRSEPSEDQSVRIIGKAWVPLGRSDWMWGDSVNTHLPGDLVTPEMQASFEEDRRLIYTLWRLMGEEQIVERSEVHRSKKAARKQRAGRRDQPVTVIHLRRPRVEGESESGESERHLSVRFMVRPHWRQQAYGPGRTLRRPVLIPPHWKGPEDAPVQVSEKVWMLDR